MGPGRRTGRTAVRDDRDRDDRDHDHQGRNGWGRNGWGHGNPGRTDRDARDDSGRHDRSDAGSAWWAGTRELALVPWEERATIRLRRRPGFRLPAPEDPAPDTRRMLGVCVWAAMLGIIGLMVAARALVALLAGTPPHWYEPTMVVAGITGILLTSAAFLAVHYSWLPWALLTAATVPLAVTTASTLLVL